MTIRTIRPGGEPLATPSVDPAPDSAAAENQRDQMSPMARLCYVCGVDPCRCPKCCGQPAACQDQACAFRRDFAEGSAFPSSAAALAAGLGGAPIVIGLDFGRQPDRTAYSLVRDGRVSLVLHEADVQVDQAGNVTVAIDARDLGDAT